MKSRLSLIRTDLPPSEETASGYTVSSQEREEWFLEKSEWTWPCLRSNQTQAQMWSYRTLFFAIVYSLSFCFNLNVLRCIFVRFPWGSKMSPLSSVGQYLGYHSEFCRLHQFITVQTDTRGFNALKRMKSLITSFSKQGQFDCFIYHHSEEDVAYIIMTWDINWCWLVFLFPQSVSTSKEQEETGDYFAAPPCGGNEGLLM